MNKVLPDSRVQTGTRKVYLDILRIIACLGVITIHAACRVIDNATIKVPVDTQEWFFGNMYDCISRFSVPVFLMISGALFISREVSIKKIWSKYICHLILAFFFWSALFDIVARGDYSLRGIVTWTLTGMGRFNFLLIMVSLYIILPILKAIVKNQKLLLYYLILNCSYLAINCLLVNISKYLGTSEAVLYFNSLKTWINRIPLSFISWTILYFVLGYIIDTYIFSKRVRTVLIIGGIVSTIFTVIMTVSDSYKAMTPVFDWMSYDSVNILIQSTGLFVLFRYLNYKMSDKTIKGIVSVSKCTLGAYVIHTYILDYFLPGTLQIDVYNLPSAIAVPSIALLTFVICIAISAVLRKIPIIRYFL